jgi:hypothetical protein
MALLVITRWYLPIIGENDPESALQRRPRTFWSLSSHDITGTLDKVIERVLKDASISAESRCERLGLRFFFWDFSWKIIMEIWQLILGDYGKSWILWEIIGFDVHIVHPFSS